MSSAALRGSAWIPLLAAMFAAPAVAAAPVLEGGRFAPSNCAECEQTSPAVAGTRRGAFLVAWEGEAPFDREGVFGRAFTPAGRPRPAVFPLTRDSSPQQSQPAIATDAKGNWIVAWTSRPSGGQDRGILGQRLRPNGAPLGAPFVLNEARAEPEVRLAVSLAPQPGGGFAAAWLTFPAPGAAQPGPPAVRLRRFDAANRALGPEVEVSTGWVSAERPEVCADPAGNLVVVWVTADELRPFQSHREGVAFRRLSPSGVAVGGPTVVSPPRAAASEAAVACGARGIFVVAWRDDQRPGGDADEVFLRRFTRLGRPLGPVQRANASIAGSQRSPAVAIDPRGAFVVVWDSSTSDAHEVRARRFRADGAADGGDVAVATLEHELSARPDLAFAGAADLVVVWQDETRVFGQRLTVPP
jgi:hypothetical protein